MKYFDRKPFNDRAWTKSECESWAFWESRIWASIKGGNGYFDILTTRVQFSDHLNYRSWLEGRVRDPVMFRSFAFHWPELDWQSASDFVLCGEKLIQVLSSNFSASGEESLLICFASVCLSCRLQKREKEEELCTFQAIHNEYITFSSVCCDLFLWARAFIC